MLGMSLPVFTQFHVVLSLIGIAAGLLVAFGMLNARRLPRLAALFLFMTAATDVTGFMFPMPFDPADVIGVIDLVFVAVAVVALYAGRLAAASRWIYVVGALFALYLNCFVLVVQTFQKVPFFHALAPTQKEPPFAAVQAALLIAFLGVGWFALRKFRPIGTGAATPA
jgi:hypothetical protein